MSKNLTYLLARLPSGVVRIGLFLLLAGLFTVNVFDATIGSRLVGSSYDTLIKQRFIAPPIDPDIVILDIDEPSLSKMAPTFGRWPWPRDTLASVLDYLEANGAQAVVFDILFADNDVLSPVADKAFSESVARSNTSFFPVLRLASELDVSSAVRADMLPGFAVNVSARAQAPTIAVIPPVFSAIVATQRLGFHNIYPDDDGVNRHYRLWDDVSDSWRLLSLPARLAEAFNWPLPAAADQLLQLPLTASAYPTVSFVEVWQASQSREKALLGEKLRGKIVVIGSSAPSLFDVKVTPLSSIQPGVHLLANAIDNVKNQRFLLTLDKGPHWILGMLLLVGMLYASMRLPMTVMRWGILVAPTALIGISYLSLNVGSVFIDLTGAASRAFVFFSLMTFYGILRVQYFGTVRESSRPFSVCTTVVLVSAPTPINLNALIDKICVFSRHFTVLQASWAAGTGAASGGPVCLFLFDNFEYDEARVRAALQLDGATASIAGVSHRRLDAGAFEFLRQNLGQSAWGAFGETLVMKDRTENEK